MDTIIYTHLDFTKFDNPGSYTEEEWYVKCKAKAETFEEAISIIKFLTERESE
jgi:hypothetical protein